MVLARQIDSLPLKIGIYSLGIMGGMSRLYNDNHWASDVFLGAMLSYACVHTAASWLENNFGKSGLSEKLLFHISPTTVSLMIAW
jgi:membrane-associated phospholipid phosphatase